MISIFNGRERTLGGETSKVYAQVGVGFRDHLHNFKGAKLGVFLAISLHANKGGWAWPSVSLLSKETGYNAGTINRALKELCTLTIKGERVLLKWQPKQKDSGQFHSNHYLLFPSASEVAEYRAKGMRNTVNNLPSVENTVTVKDTDKVEPSLKVETTKHVANATPAQDETDAQYYTTTGACGRCKKVKTLYHDKVCATCYDELVDETKHNGGVFDIRYWTTPAPDDATDEPCTCGNEGLCGNCGKPADEPPSLVPVKPLFDGGPDGYLPPVPCGDERFEPPLWPWECAVCGKRAAINKDNIVNCPHCDASYHRDSAPNQEPPTCADCGKLETTTADMRDVHNVCICKQESALVDEFGPRPPRKPQKPVEHWTQAAQDPRTAWGAESDEFQRGLKQYHEAGRDVQLLGADWQQLTQCPLDWGDKKAVKTWSSGLWACLKAAGGDASVVLDATREAIQEGLSIANPYSVLKMTQSLVGKRKRGEPKAKVTPMLDQRGLSKPNPLARRKR